MPIENSLTALGLMSGLSMNGIEVALVKTDGDGSVDRGPAMHIDYDPATKAALIRATKAAQEGRDDAKDIRDAASHVTSAHVDAVRTFLSVHKHHRTDIDVIGFHGHTILHKPPVDAAGPGRTWQIGGGGILAQETKIDVVDQFRTADMANGGHGAPFAPVYHTALAKKRTKGAIAIVHMGWITSISYVACGADPNDVIAFDCGPCTNLIDQWVYRHTGEQTDKDGRLALGGVVDEEALALMLLNPFIRKAAPKRLDRRDLKMSVVEGLSVADGAATLTDFSAACVAKAQDHLPEPPVEWIICGAGRQNPALMSALRDRIDAPVLTTEEKGWDNDAMRAESIGYLAVRSLKKLPLSYPMTTGVPHPISGGTYHPAPIG